MRGRIASIWLPRLAIERWAKSDGAAPDDPVALTVEGTHGPIIHAVTPAAAARGARAGARLTDARAIDPGLAAFPADPAGDAALLERLARWAGRWSPLVEVDGDGLRLDIGGVAHLFGGEAALQADMAGRFATMGLSVRTAIADTPLAAWALARFHRSPKGIDANHDGRTPSPCPLPAGEREIVRHLSGLPVAALRLDAGTVRTLERLGLKTIADVSAVPRLALARRFRGGADVVAALDRLTGRTPEPLTALAEDLPPRAALRLQEPATHVEAASQALGQLIPPLVAELEERRLGARRLALTGYRVDGSVAVASVATTIPSREPAHLLRLLADKAAALDPGFGFDAFALAADWAEPLGPAQDALVGEPPGTRDVARLIDRLTVKLGPGRVRRPRARESHLPERASGWQPAVDAATDIPAPVAVRPQRLLDRPEAIAVIYATPEGVPRRFVWRRKVHDIALVEGPERIAPEWWRERSSSRLRDYYRVEDETGRRYWIYREGLIGDGRGGAPEWYVHGLFG